MNQVSVDDIFPIEHDICARPPACGRGGEKNGPQALGRSRGGLTTQVHAWVEGLGNLTRGSLTGGEVSDITQAQALLDGLEPDAVVADKAYDSEEFIDAINAKGVIPPRANRREQREVDRHRNLIERFFCRMSLFVASPLATIIGSTVTRPSSLSSLLS